MLCALDQVRLEHCSPPPPPPSLSSCSPSFHRLFDVFAMNPSSTSSEQEHLIQDGGYFSSTSGRQRTAQACDKCRERKTKVRVRYRSPSSPFPLLSLSPSLSFLSPFLHIYIYVYTHTHIYLIFVLFFFLVFW